VVPVCTRGHQPHQAISDPDAVVSGRVRIFGVDLEEHEQLRCTRLTLEPSGVPADEVALVERDEPVEAGRAGCDVLSAS